MLVVPYSSYFAIHYCCTILCLWNTAVHQVFQGSVLRVLPTTGSISSGCYCEYWYCEYCTDTTSTTSIRSSTTILSISAVYWEHIFVHRIFDNLIRIFLQTAFTVLGRSHEWELEL